MRLLCVPCDEAMTLDQAQGGDGDSMTVVFGCPRCGRETALLINPMETQVVRSLGVTIGNRANTSEPMEMIRGRLTQQHDDLAGAEEFSISPVQEGEGKSSGSGCPFTERVENAYEEAGDDRPSWTPAARKRLQRIPSAARPMARKGIEDYARERGFSEIDEAVMDAVRGQLGG